MGTSSTVRPSSATLENLAAGVHTYESFGRAVISQVLAESSKATALKDGGVPAQFAVKAMTNPTHGEPFCVTVSVTIDNTCHYISVCAPTIHIS
jgi:hypothetical protein